MFGNRYFGARYFGDRYFGEGGSGTPPDVGPGARRGGGFLRAIGRLMNR